jgi:glycosyltransferase involved in cell wall biosynthesis
LAALPRHVEGFSRVEWLIIDDGSTDGTVRVAKEHGADHVILLYHNYGLARAFMAGLDACLRLGADVIVNTDADNQYNAEDIPKLVRPILDGRAEIVVGARPIHAIKHFSGLKKALQRIGSFVVQKLSQTQVADAPSGFRAIHRRAAMQLNVFNEFSYTIETIIQAGQKNMPITSVPIRVNDELRPSRLFKSIGGYASRMLLIMTRIFVIYRALRFFTFVGALIMTPGVLLGLRYLWLNYTGKGAGNVQSLILAAVFLLAGFFVMLSGLLADLSSVNRKLLEEVRSRLMYLEQDLAVSGSREHAAEDDPPAAVRVQE